jgi:hypothetical protein
MDNLLEKIMNKQTFGEKNLTFKFGLKKFNLESYSHTCKNMKERSTNLKHEEQK